MSSINPWVLLSPGHSPLSNTYCLDVLFGIDPGLPLNGRCCKMLHAVTERSINQSRFSVRGRKCLFLLENCLAQQRCVQQGPTLHCNGKEEVINNGFKITYTSWSRLGHMGGISHFAVQIIDLDLPAAIVNENRTLPRGCWKSLIWCKTWQQNNSLDTATQWGQ